MLIKIDEIKTNELTSFFGGNGALLANIFYDGTNKILKGRLAENCSIGEHKHEGTAEIIFIISGTGRAICDGVEESVSAGCVHYCKEGSTHCLENTGKEDLVFFAVVPKQ